MIQSEYDFCSKYISEFLGMVNYPVDESMALIEKYHEDAILKVEAKYKNSPLYNMMIKEIDDDYNRQRFDFIKIHVADIDPEFFNERITNMKRLLVNNKDYAIRLGMKVIPTIIDDYYNNYLIAFERVLRAEINPILK